MQAARLQEASAERDAAQAGLERARAEAERAVAGQRDAEGREREAGLRLRVAETELRLRSGAAESGAREAEGLRAELAGVVAAKASLAERLGAAEAELAVRREAGAGGLPAGLDRLLDELRAAARPAAAAGTGEVREGGCGEGGDAWALVERERERGRRLEEEMAVLRAKLLAAEAARRRAHNEVFYSRCVLDSLSHGGGMRRGGVEGLCALMFRTKHQRVEHADVSLRVEGLCTRMFAPARGLDAASFPGGLAGRAARAGPARHTTTSSA